MNKQTWIILVAALALIGGTAGLLLNLRVHQRLGPPAVKTHPIPGSLRLQVDLPLKALDYTSTPMEVDKATMGWLPQDTSFGQRGYEAPDGFQVAVNVVLMGSDRTSLHQTEFCLEGQGWRIDRSVSGPTIVRMDRPYPYDLPVMKFIASREMSRQGHSVMARGVYVAWFVADGDEFTPHHWQRMWWMARDLIRTGVLKRWAMISYFAICPPGQEDATYERLKKLIVASAPEIQLVPRPTGPTRLASP